ncbi:MAG: hypothetical protein ACXWNL_16110 [Vulcanimicrobiaceae bacterium]
MLDGTDPDSVLVRVRNAEGVSLATRKDYGRPIDYLRYRVKNPISDAMFMAAEFYGGDYHAISAVGSNTAATIDHLMKAVPLEASDRRMLDQEGINSQRMHPKSECHEAKDPSERMLGAAFALKRVDEKLDRVQRSLLRDLIVQELTIGTIAQRWRWSPDAAGVMVRYALQRLVDVYELLREDFATYLRQERQGEVEAALGI